MKEYKTLSVELKTGYFSDPANFDTNALDAAFNKLAAQGWELDCIQDLQQTGDSRCLLCVFSRHQH